MPACLAREDLGQSILLTLVCLFVHVEGDLPFDLQHVSGRIGSQHRVKSIQIDLSEAALIDVPGNQNSAFPTCGRACKDARTRYFAVTGLKVRSGNFPRSRHRRGLRFKRSAFLEPGGRVSLKNWNLCNKLSGG